jgi:aspartate/methionine/tyrosine aminotransferase
MNVENRADFQTTAPRLTESKRTSIVEPFIVMDVLERAQEIEKEGRSVIHLEIGEPDFATPARIVEAAHAALRRGETHYTHSLGTPELREAIAQHYAREYGVTVDPGQVIVTLGTSPGLLLTLSTLLDPGDEIILSNPCYACYANFVHYLGATPRFVNISPEDDFQLSAGEVRRKLGPRTKAVLINSPANPTGTLLSAQSLSELAELPVAIVSDEIYHGLVYGQKAHSILEFTDNAIVLNGFSKRFAMTGWRLGYVIVPKQYVRPIQKLQQNFFISPNSFVQAAGACALTEVHPELDEMVREYDARRRRMVAGLRDIGFGVRSEPRGAFYVFADARVYSSDSYRFAFELLERVGVATAPGIDFGSNGEGFLRFSYANSIENIERALDRLKKYLEDR